MSKRSFKEEVLLDLTTDEDIPTKTIVCTHQYMAQPEPHAQPHQAQAQAQAQPHQARVQLQVAQPQQFMLQPLPLREPSAEQRHILRAVREPRVASDGMIFRVIAAAGSGKTYTLCLLADALLRLQHKVHYVVFNKTAADDASGRMGRGVTAGTLHSCAFQIMGVKEGNIKTEEQIDAEVRRLCGQDIDDFLSGVITPRDCSENKKEKYHRTVAIYIRKTLCSTFMQGSRSEADGLSPLKFNVHYNARLFHEGKLAYEQDLPRALRKPLAEVVTFYTSQASKMWRLFQPSATGSPPLLNTFDSVLKRAQLEEKRIDCSVLMVDESQDLSTCQIDWLHMQCSLYGIDIFVVGDPVQTIYSFRGANCKCFLDIDTYGENPRPRVHTFSLTSTYRFGPEIASVANVILFAKFMSPQSLKQLNYRVVGRGVQGMVTAHNLALDLQADGTCWPFTAIGRSNLDILIFAFETIFPCGKPARLDLKFHVLGKGESSGRAKWYKIFGKFDAFYNVYLGGSTLKHYPWVGLKNLNWDQVCKDVVAYDLSDFVAIVGIINQYKDKTQEILLAFEQHVLKSNTSQQEAHIIVGTPHAAKGLEWDRVQVLPGFVRLDEVTSVDRSGGAPSVQFAFKSWDDEINMWYVAVTRARHILSLPSTFMDLVRGLEQLRDAGQKIIARETAVAPLALLGPPASPVHVHVPLFHPVTPPTPAMALAFAFAPAPTPTPTPTLTPSVTETFLLGKLRRTADVRVMYDMLYKPLKNEQNQPINDYGLVIDGLYYYFDPAGP